MEKRGISAVVVTIMLVLISILAVVIVWQAIQTLVEEGSQDIGTGFTNINLKLEIINVKNLTNEVNVTIKRGAGEGDLENIKVVLYDDEASETKNTKDVFKEELKQLETKTYNFSSNLAPNLKKVEIYPVINGKIGNIADTYQVS